MRTIKVTPNHANRTFTIRTYDNGKLNNKYRTVKLSIESELNNTENDWSQFLKSSDYYKV